MERIEVLIITAPLSRQSFEGPVSLSDEARRQWVFPLSEEARTSVLSAECAEGVSGLLQPHLLHHSRSRSVDTVPLCSHSAHLPLPFAICAQRIGCRIHSLLDAFTRRERLWDACVCLFLCALRRTRFATCSATRSPLALAALPLLCSSA